MSSAPAPRSTPATLVVRTVGIPDPGPLVDLLPEGGALSWVRRGDGMVGWGEAARLRTSGPGRFADAEAWWSALVDGAVVRDDVAVPGSGLVAFGSFAFDDRVVQDGPATSSLVVPQVLVGRRGDMAWVTTVAPADSIPYAPELARGSIREPQGVSFADGALSGTEWEAVVAEALRRIAAGELDKVVLARDLLALADEPVDVRWALRRLVEGYPGCWTYAMDGLLGATPEMLIRLERGLATSRVLAGTIRRTGHDTADLALSASLARSSKDLEEHEFAVRSVAQALRPHTSSMNVPEAPFVLHLPNVMHLASDVTAVVSDAASSLRLVAALHPSAAVCGTPTDVAREVIREIEGMDRGRYAGPVGWVDADGDGEWGIALRCAQVDPEDPSRLRLYAGCGIVAGSDPQSELVESNAKLVPMRDALGS